MAADVRKDENENATADGIESFSVFSDSALDQLSSISLESDDVVLNGELPSYMIVHQQMRDALALQRATAEMQLRSNIIQSCRISADSKLDRWWGCHLQITASNASKQCLNNTLECQGKTIRNLEISIQNDYVLKTDFEELAGKLEEERNHHQETQARLAEALNRLEACKAEAVAALTNQREKEQAAFQRCCDSLTEDLQELKIKNRKLKLLIKDKCLACDELQSQVLKQKQEFGQLKDKHETQKKKWKQTASEAEVEKQQEAYLKQMSAEKCSKKKSESGK